MHLSIEDVSKQYTRDVWGTRDFTLDLEPGVLVLLGPNGAGKSTLMTMLATIARPAPGRSSPRPRCPRRSMLWVRP
jgi:ABC-2 type transport system ATP-binding protein